MSQKKIVLMACGSFSPPTFMHMRMFEIARDYINSLGLGNVVGGIMSPVHDAYGKKDLVAAHHRLAMLRLALNSSDWVKVSEWETNQEGWTRTRVTMSYHQETINRFYSSTHNSDPPSWLPDDILNVNIDEVDNIRVNGNDNNEVSVKLLCGADLLESFATPGLWSDDDLEAIVGGHGLVVVTRSGCDPERFIYESDMLYKYRKNITLVSNYIVNEVSSTALRRLLRRSLSPKYLTDDSVIHYIRLHGLYGAKPLVTEYCANITQYDEKTPDDVYMRSPNETYRNIVITIKDRSITEDSVETTVKRPRKANFLMPHTHTNSVSPLVDVKPKIAFNDKVPITYNIPGKAVKIGSDGKTTLQDEKVSEYTSLDSYLLKEEVDYELYQRRVSEGNLTDGIEKKEIKKRCSASTIRKLGNKEVKKSKSEVSKLCEKIKSVKLKDTSGRNYKTRSCNDIVRLVLTKHGIHVISDTEAIV